MPSGLLIMHCPYCGSGDIAETNRVEGHLLESVAIFCLSCKEECVIDRNLDTEDLREEAEEERKEGIPPETRNTMEKLVKLHERYKKGK